MALPTRPLCPATNILESVFILYNDQEREFNA
jgi:hypothetical protein